MVNFEKNKPLILVTNDDGITSKGIASLVEAVRPFGQILVVAPDKPQSGMGHAISVHDILRLTPYHEFYGIQAFSCSGTPVDCVKLAIYEILDSHKPDFLVSGVNHGNNSSTNVLYSGTMSAAVEGALENIPSIGFSLDDFAADADFSVCSRVVQTMMQAAMTHEFPKNICLNVNIPKLSLEEFKGIKICRQAHAFWKDRFDKRIDQFGKPYYWLTGEFENFDAGEDTDVWALNNGYASVVPIQFDMTAHNALPALNNWHLRN
jgi:5'-nucleotidase